jgi:hypothetical protein
MSYAADLIPEEGGRQLLQRLTRLCEWVWAKESVSKAFIDALMKSSGRSVSVIAVLVETSLM